MRRLSYLGGLTAAVFSATILILPAAAADKKPADKGWVQLFDGKDLKGWKTHPDDKAKWEVKDGMIVGTGDKGTLFTDRGDYENFRFRIEAAISHAGNSGQFFRAKFMKAHPLGYEAQINSSHKDPIRTGSLYPAFDKKLTAEQKKKILVFEAPHKDDEFFTQEVIADGNHIIIKVNGKTTVDFVDEKNTYKKGYLGIQQHNLGSVIKVRKAEIMELPPSK